MEKAINFLPSLITALVIFILTIVLAGIIRRGVRHALNQRKAAPHVRQLLSKIAYWSMLILGSITALQQVGFNLTAFLTGLGILGFTIGFALQDISKNFVSGMLMLIQEPFNVGDVIDVAGITGIVQMIDLRATEIKTLDGRIVLIPNSDVYTKAITNFTKADIRRVEISLGVAYESDLSLVRKTALESISSVKGLMSEPAPLVCFQNFGGSTIDLTLYYWINTKETNPWAAKDEGLVAINNAFNAVGIDMPFPTQRIFVQS